MQEERPSAVIEHEDGSTTIIYRWNDDNGPPAGMVMAVLDPDAKDDEDAVELMEITDRRWASCPVVFMSPTDFDMMDALIG